MVDVFVFVSVSVDVVIFVFTSISPDSVVVFEIVDVLILVTTSIFVPDSFPLMLMCLHLYHLYLW